MADDTMHHPGDLTLHDALERLERAEAELEQTEEHRRRLADEATRAASELESVLGDSIGKAISKRDRLEEELAAVLDHIARLEAIRARSTGEAASVAVRSGSTAPIVHTDDEAPEDDGQRGSAHEDQWHELMKSRDDGAFTI